MLMAGLLYKNVNQAGVLVDGEVDISICPKSVHIRVDGDGRGPQLVVVGDASVMVHLPDRVRQHIKRPFIAENIHYLLNCTAAEPLAVIVIGNSLFAST